MRSFWEARPGGPVFHKEPSAWQCAIDDRLPTLAQVLHSHAPAHEGRPCPACICVPASGRLTLADARELMRQVFAEVPQHVGFDVEVKMATPKSCSRTPQVLTLQRTSAI
jgi:hypothetical protein